MRPQLPVGGNTRAGLGDNVYVESGVMVKSSAEQEEKIVAIAKKPGIDPCAPDEARQILGLNTVNY